MLAGGLPAPICGRVGGVKAAEEGEVLKVISYCVPGAVEMLKRSHVDERPGLGD